MDSRKIGVRVEGKGSLFGGKWGKGLIEIILFSVGFIVDGYIWWCTIRWIDIISEVSMGIELFLIVNIF